MRLIKLKEVILMTGLGRSSIYKFMGESKFPQSISLGERCVAWELGEVEEWIQEKIQRRNETDVSVTVKTNAVEITEVDVILFIKNKFSDLSLSDAISWLALAYK